jgi:hypothetical protein
VPRFVVLEHTGTPTYKPGTHWDLMLEAGGSLRTWELDAVPTPGAIALAVPLPDHRLDYLQYEGPISGNRGTVRRYDCGTYETLRESQLELVVRIEGQELHGDFYLRRGQADSAAPWQISVEPS